MLKVAKFLKILVIVEAEIATTHLVMQVLRAARQFGIMADLVVSSQWKARELSGDILPIFIRCADPTMLPYAYALAKVGRPYLYYLDDDFWSLDVNTPLGAYYSDPHVRKCLDYFVSHAALVLTNTSQLAERLREHSHKIALVPTFFNFDLLNGVVPESTDEIRIGFAGSAGRQMDLELIKSAITPVLASNPRVVFEFIGTMPQGVKPCHRIRSFPPMENYADFVRFQASRNWSIGLAPLLETVSNRSKTDNKFREYSASSIAGIYSDYGPYPVAVTDGVDGLLVRDGDWAKSILSLVNEPNRLRAVRSSAYNAAVARYDINNASRIWANIIVDTAKNIETGPTIDLVDIRRKIFLHTLIGRWARVQITYRQGGLKMVCKKITVRLSCRLGLRGGHNES